MSVPGAVIRRVAVGSLSVFVYSGKLVEVPLPSLMDSAEKPMLVVFCPAGEATLVALTLLEGRGAIVVALCQE